MQNPAEQDSGRESGTSLAQMTKDGLYNLNTNMKQLPCYILQSTMTFTINVRYGYIWNHNFPRKVANINVKNIAAYT